MKLISATIYYGHKKKENGKGQKGKGQNGKGQKGKGQKGQKGANGQNGANGAQGAKGDHGFQGANGQQGSQGFWVGAHQQLAPVAVSMQRQGHLAHHDGDKGQGELHELDAPRAG